MDCEETAKPSEIRPPDDTLANKKYDYRNDRVKKFSNLVSYIDNKAPTVGKSKSKDKRKSQSKSKSQNKKSTLKTMSALSAHSKNM